MPVQSLIVDWYPLFLFALLAAWSALLPSALSRLRRRLARTRPGTAYLLGAVVLGALVIRMAQPRIHRVYYDEFEHLSAARTLTKTGRFAEALVGGVRGWDVLQAPAWPGGHHAALAAVFRVFGDSTAVAFNWSALLSGLTVVFIFWAALESGAEERGALAAAFAWAVSPLALRYAAACDLTSSSLFWSAAALAALHARESEPGFASDAFAALSLAYAVQVRPENVLLIGYAALTLRRRSLILPALAGAVFPAVIALLNRAAGIPGYSPETTKALADLQRQLPVNIAFLASALGFSLVIVPAAALGAARPPVRRLALLSALFLAVYSSFFMGRFNAGGADRYALAVMLPLTVAAAAGLARAPLAAVLLLAGLAWRGPGGPDPERAREERFAASARDALPPGALVIAFNAPAARELLDRAAADANLVLADEDDFVRRLALVGSPPLVLYKDWAWRWNPGPAAELRRRLDARYDETPAADDGVDSVSLLSARARPR
ncbi:MAG: hypothetical protein HKL90_04070 [Elusimicrobia bacterium]|nr:hypothetical protein [Elusimicrobiota bacterium]